MSENEQPTFTRRELDVIRANPDCPTGANLAAYLGMQEHTLKHHVTRILKKTGCDNRLDLLVWSIKSGLVQIEGPNVPRLVE